MSPAVRCPVCGCDRAGDAAPHPVVAALLEGDLDRAIATGLLDCGRCAGCSDDCNDALLAARDARLRALDARERHRARAARLEARAANLAARRVPTRTIAADAAATVRPALPAAAAAALARAKARAAERHKP